MSELLEVRDINAFYGDLQYLWDISLDVKQGEMAVLVGPNGAGKTTLLRSIAGLERPPSGTIMFDGEPIHALAAHRIVDRGIILVPEGRRLFNRMSVLENLELGAFNGRARREKNATL